MKETVDKSPISRRDFVFEVVPKLTTAVGLALAGCNRSAPTAETANRKAPDPGESGGIYWVESGETKQLAYFTFDNQMPDYFIEINEYVFEERARTLDLPLKNAQSLQISLLKDRQFVKQPETLELLGEGEFLRVQLLGSGNEAIEIAGGRLEQEYLNKGGRLPVNSEGQVLLSFFLSSAIFSGHCQLAIKRGELSYNEAWEKTAAYVESIINLEQPRLIALMSPTSRRRQQLTA